MIMNILSRGVILAIPLVLIGALNARAEGNTPRETLGNATTHTVEIKGFKYSPEILTLTVGDTVRWVNLDAAPHTATAGNENWDSGKLKRGEEWSFTTTETGKTQYICTYHPVMKGLLIVKERGQ